MYIIQELCSDGIWSDRYSNYDYEMICEMYLNFQFKYPSSKFRLIEVFYYV